MTLAAINTSGGGRYKMSCLTHNPALFICTELAPKNDDHHLDSINKIVERQEEINKHLDKLLVTLGKSQQLLAENADLKEFNLDEIQDQLAELNEIFSETGHPLPEFDTEFSTLSKHDLERLVAWHESTKRHLQNEVPQLSTQLTMVVEQFLMISKLLQEGVSKQQELGSHIMRKS